MKITDVTTETYRWPRHKPISNGLHTYTHSGLGLVKIHTDEGTIGVGVGSTGAIAKATIEHLKPELIGEDPIDVERLWHKMWMPKLVGRRGLTTRAISGIDIALWDLRAKVAGMPLYKMLGGFRNRMPTYIAGGYYEEGKGLKELQQEMYDNVEMGAKAIKMKIGAVPIREDVERVKAVREAIGPDVKLLVDANCAYRAYEAIQIARAMRGVRHLLVRGAGRARRLRGPQAAGRDDDHPDRDGRERVHPLRLPRPDRDGRGADPERGCQGAGRRDRVHEGGGATPRRTT